MVDQVGDPDPAQLPTPVAQALGRFLASDPHEASQGFLYLSYLLEAHLKTAVLVGVSGLRDVAPDLHYEYSYRLARASGVGDWAAVLTTLASHGVVSFLPPYLSQYREWLTRNRSRNTEHEAHEALGLVFGLLEEIGHSQDRVPEKFQITALARKFVELRNKTKAHGALGSDYYEKALPSLRASVFYFVSSFPFTAWNWYFLRRRPSGSVLGIRVLGPLATRVLDSEVERLQVARDGLHLVLDGESRVRPLGSLIQTTPECRTFFFANGSLEPKTGAAEFIDYQSGRLEYRDLTEFLRPPAPIGASSTEGLAELDVHANLWGNLPPEPNRYIPRPLLESSLRERLKDQNHAIITLHGAGGVGKTTLALKLVYELSAEKEPRFDCILWFSARDIDLTAQGPRRVRRGVADLESAAKAVGRLLDLSSGDLPTLSATLRKTPRGFERGVLFVFDNFETLDDVRGVHEFLDEHTHLPNKVLITSRERAFKADFPIEVQGMERQEAFDLLVLIGRELQIEGLLDEQTKGKIFEATQGHPYLLRVLSGEVQKAGRFVPIKSVLPQLEKVREALFERTFNGLSEDGRRVFFVVSSWRSPVLEVALQAVLLPRNVDVTGGVEECRRLSLINEVILGDGARAFTCPDVARIFGEKKLKGDPDRLLVAEELDLLVRFGVLGVSGAARSSEEEVLRRFFRWLMAEGSTLPEVKRSLLLTTLEALAHLRPEAWLELAEFRKQFAYDEDAIHEALRRATEEFPNRVDAWKRRADYAMATKREALAIQCLVSAVESTPEDIALVREVAYQLCGYLDRHREIPPTRRGVYLASVRQIMEKSADKLDATGLSRLAWLFLLEDQKERARQYASLGLDRERLNQHCRKILERLAVQGA